MCRALSDWKVKRAQGTPGRVSYTAVAHRALGQGGGRRRLSIPTQDSRGRATHLSPSDGMLTSATTAGLEARRRTPALTVTATTGYHSWRSLQPSQMWAAPTTRNIKGGPTSGSRPPTTTFSRQRATTTPKSLDFFNESGGAAVVRVGLRK